MFSPSRLKIARMRLGVTRTKLAESAGLSLRSLTAYENGESVPSGESLNALAEALSVPIAFMEGDEVDLIPLEAATFRALSKASARRRNAVCADASMAVEFFSEVERHFDLPKPDIPALEGADPSQAAEFVRRSWSLGDRPISNMLHLLEAKGARVAALRDEFSDIDAFSFIRDGTPYVLLNMTKSAERMRFDLAHELGHLVLHLNSDLDPSRAREREVEANNFAACFLMPETAIFDQSMSNASINRILAARRYWKVSAMALAYRLHTLQLLSDWQYRSTCISLTEMGFRTGEPDGIQPETSQVLKKVLYGKGVGLGTIQLSRELRIFPEEVVSLVHGLVPASLPGGRVTSSLGGPGGREAVKLRSV